MKMTDRRDTEQLVMSWSTFLHANKVKVKGQGHPDMGNVVLPERHLGLRSSRFPL